MFHGYQSRAVIYICIFFGNVSSGLILPNGDINWNCPCLGGMASGPCGQQFKEAFSCFHYSKEEVKGSECLENFRGMQECMQRYPELYPQEDDSEPPKQTEDAAQTATDEAVPISDKDSASPAPVETSPNSEETAPTASPPES